MLIFLYYINAAFLKSLTPTFGGQGYIKKMTIKCRQFQYSLEPLPGIILSYCSFIFTSVFILFANFSHPHSPSLVSGIFIEAGLLKIDICPKGFGL